MIGKYFLAYHTKRFNRKNIRRYSTTFENADTIGIICSYQSVVSEPAINDFQIRLDQMGKKVSKLVFHDNSGKLESGSNNFNRSDLSVLGTWKSDVVKSFVAKEFDFLIHLDLRSNIYINNVMAQSRALCRVGAFHEGLPESLEMMIKPKELTLACLIEEVFEVLERVKNNE